MSTREENECSVSNLFSASFTQNWRSYGAKTLLFSLSQKWKRIFEMNAFVVFILEIHLSYVESNSQNNMYIKFVHYEERTFA